MQTERKQGIATIRSFDAVAGKEILPDRPFAHRLVKFGQRSELLRGGAFSHDRRRNGSYQTVSFVVYPELRLDPARQRIGHEPFASLRRLPAAYNPR